MKDAVRVEIVPRTVDADPATIEERLHMVERLRELGHLDGDGDVDRTVTRWYARFGDVMVPLDAFDVQPPQGGEGDTSALVSLLIPADSVHIGTPSTGSPQAPAAENKPTLQVWGSTVKDPRESIPGWTPEPQGDQLYASPVMGDRKEDAIVHDHTLTKWTCGCDPALLGIMDAVAKTGNIDVRVVQG